MSVKRRTFLDILSKGTASALLLPYFSSACSGPQSQTELNVDHITGISPDMKDHLLLADGLEYELLIKWGDPINDKDKFGFNNDFLCFIPDPDNENEGILWSNHEYVNSLFIHGQSPSNTSIEEIDKERYNVGGTLVKIIKRNGSWKMVLNDPQNRRITGETQIPFHWHEKIVGAHYAVGTLGNCAGGLTPWGTILTCEENYQDFYRDRNSKGEWVTESIQKWEKAYPMPPEHYGWIVEVDPVSGDAKKHISLGRCAHECATVVELPDQRLVVYTGDDKNDECVYKFISSEPGSLDSGTLYVADTINGQWIPIDFDQQVILQDNFSSQTEVLIYLRESSRLLGGTPLDRPEDIEIDPVNGNVLVALTNNIPKENFFGSILKIEEDGGRHDALTFKATTYLTGGEETGFASPDNMVFDLVGNLWFTSDISGSKLNKPPYEAFGNNGLFLVMRDGPQAGKVIQLASAPVDAELTGPWFSPDGKTLFLSVQHPGETSASIDQLSSDWPDGNGQIPKPSVVTLKGPLLDKVQRLV